MTFMYKTKSLWLGAAAAIVLAHTAALPAYAQDTDSGPRWRAMPGHVTGQRPAAGNRGVMPQRGSERAGPRAMNRAAMTECMGEAGDRMGERMTAPARRGEPGGPLLGRFDTLDTNDDGYLDEDELLAGPRERMVDTFTQLDANADGLLSREELQTAREGQFERREELRRCIEEVREGSTAGD